MTNLLDNGGKIAKTYDLQQRTKEYAKNAITFAKRIPETTITKILISQFVRSATSIGANYCEADNAESIKDFIHKTGICKKEAREAEYWLELIGYTLPILEKDASVLKAEARELMLIFNAIIKTSNKNLIAIND